GGAVVRVALCRGELRGRVGLVRHDVVAVLCADDCLAVRPAPARGARRDRKAALPDAALPGDPDRVRAGDRRHHRERPARQLLAYAAIFFTFGTVGFIQDTWTVLTPYPWAVVAVWAAYSGLVAVGYAVATSRYRLLLPFVFAFHMLVPTYVIKPLQAPFDAAA